MEPAPEVLDRKSFSLWRVALLVVVLGSACALTIRVAANRIVDQAHKDSEQTMLHWFELTTPTPRRLDPRFVDADNDLVADGPQDAASRKSPDRLVFSYVAGPEAESEIADWKDFVAHLERVTGKSVEAVVFRSSSEQLEALVKGTLHVTAFNTGVVPEAVASCGFVPICTFGRDDGAFGITMQLIVPSESTVQKLEDLKGGTVTFTTRDSNSGCKAALALLQEHDLLPMRDYLYKFSGSHEESMKGVVAGHYQAAPVASDLLQGAIDSGAIKPEQFRTIYESERFPPATLGCAYDLSEDLANGVRKAFFGFSCRGTTLEKRFETARATKFVPLSYKQDYALVRRIDAAFRKPTAVGK